MRRSSVSIAMLLPLIAAPTAAAESQRLFGCGIGNSETDFISINATEQDYSWGDLQFSIERGGVVDALVPAQPQPGPGPFFFSNSDGPEGYYAQVRFSDGAYVYVLHMLDSPAEPGQDDDMGGRWGGLTITDPDGSTEELPCGETEEYIGNMAQAMACDMTNRYGVAGCDFDVRPVRAADDKLPPGYAP